MNEQYEFEEHLALYKDLYMSEKFTEEDAEMLAINLMRACGVNVEKYYEKPTNSGTDLH